MNTYKHVTLLAFWLILAFVIGRYTATETIKTDTQTSETDHKTTEADRDKHKETTVTEVTHPDGTTEKTTKTVEDSHVTKNVTDQNQKNTDTKTETIKGGSSTVNLAFIAGLDLSAKEPVYGGYASKQILGPITAGVWGLTNGTVGASVGLSF